MKTVAFMQDVLSEVIDLFPSRFIHIGGDEANLRLWTDDPELQAEMKRTRLQGRPRVAQLVHQTDGHLSDEARPPAPRLG